MKQITITIPHIVVEFEEDEIPCSACIAYRYLEWRDAHRCLHSLYPYSHPISFSDLYELFEHCPCKDTVKYVDAEQPIIGNS